jgi:hypothetical protein
LLRINLVGQRWGRWWPVAALVLLAVSVVTISLALDRLSREPPNYSRIEDGLWLGGFVREPPPGCRAVLNLCEAQDSFHAEAHRWEPIRDAEPVPGLDWLLEQVVFIESQRAAGRGVYVHCLNGVSRSAMVMAAYLMRREAWSRDQALKLLQAKRPGVRPNPAFMRLLLEWERSINAERKGT